MSPRRRYRRAQADVLEPLSAPANAHLEAAGLVVSAGELPNHVTPRVDVDEDRRLGTWHVKHVILSVTQNVPVVDAGSISRASHDIAARVDAQRCRGGVARHVDGAEFSIAEQVPASDSRSAHGIKTNKVFFVIDCSRDSHMGPRKHVLSDRAIPVTDEAAIHSLHRALPQHGAM